MDFKNKVRELENELHRQMRLVNKKELVGMSYGETLRHLQRNTKDKTTNLEDRITWRTLVMEEALRLSK